MDTGGPGPPNPACTHRGADKTARLPSAFLPQSPGGNKFLRDEKNYQEKWQAIQSGHRGPRSRRRWNGCPIRWVCMEEMGAGSQGDRRPLPPREGQRALGRPAAPEPLAHGWLLRAALGLLLGRQTLFALLSLKTMLCCDTLESEDKCLIKGFNLMSCQNLIRSTMHRGLCRPFN